MYFRRIWAICAFFLGLSVIVPLPANAQQEPAIDPRLAKLSPDLLSTLANAAAVEDFTVAATNLFRSIAGPDEILTATEIEEQHIVDAAQSRAATLEKILAADLDGDGSVSRDEVQRTFTARNRGVSDNSADAAGRMENELQATMRADADGDQAVSFAEMLAMANGSAESQSLRQKAARRNAVMVFDTDGDNRLSLSDVRAEAPKLFALVDLDGDQLLSAEERQAIQKQAQRIQQQQQTDAMLADCDFDRPQAGQKVAVIHAGRGLSIPRVSLVGTGTTTWSAAIAVQPGPEPFWILASADEPMLWHMEGADERVAKLIVVPGAQKGPMAGGLPPVVGNESPAAGVIGLTAEKIQFVDPSRCQWSEIVRAQAQNIPEVMTRILGRAPDVQVVSPTIFAVILPEGTLSPVAPSASDKKPEDLIPLDHWQIAEGFGTIPIVKVDPEQIVATGKIEPYDVLPGENGIVDLALSGAIVSRPANSFLAADHTRLKMATRYRGNIFEIVQPIAHFPAELPDRNGVTYVLAPGVPMPDGMPKRSCVLDGATGKPLNRSPLCRRD